MMNIYIYKECGIGNWREIESAKASIRMHLLFYLMVFFSLFSLFLEGTHETTRGII